MEQNLVKPGPTHSANWKPGQSGNLNGRPVGVRNQFTMAFVQDLRDVWLEVGKETMIKTAKNQPEAFFATCARILPKDVAISIEQQFPGKPLEPTMGKCVGQGSLTGRWKPRPEGCPNIRGGITIERDLPAKTRLWLTGWTKTMAGGEFVEIADEGGRPNR